MPAVNLSGAGARADTAMSISSARFRAIISVTLLIMFGFGMIVPTLPLFVKRFGLGEAGVGLLLTVFAAMRLGGDFVAGRLIDRHGEQRMVGIGVAIVGISSILAGAAPNYGLLVAFRGVGGIGSAFFLGALTAHLIATVPDSERGRAMGIFQGSIGVGLLLGPAVGGVIAAATSVNVPLYFYGGICLVATPLALRVIERHRKPSEALAEYEPGAPMLEESPPPPAPPAWQALKPLMRDSAYRAALMATAAGFWVTSALQTLIPGFWVDVLARPKGAVGTPFTFFGLASLAVIWHGAKLSDRSGRKTALVPALGVMAVACAALGYASGPATLIVLIAVVGVGSGYARPGPTAIVADCAPENARGIAVSGYRTAGDIGALLGPILVGVFAQTLGYRWAFGATGAFSAIAFAFAVVARETAPQAVSAA
jgi:MFS family permease